MLQEDMTAADRSNRSGGRSGRSPGWSAEEWNQPPANLRNQMADQFESSRPHSTRGSSCMEEKKREK